MGLGPRTQDDDTTLAQALTNRSQAALEEVYCRHGGASIAIARHVTGNDEIANDVVQDVFVRLWEQPDRYQPGRGSLHAYLMLETQHRAIDRLRSDAARRRREDREQRLRAEQPTADGDMKLWEELLNLRLREAIVALTEGERSAIELAYFGGYTYREVATMLGEPEGTIKSRIRSGLHRLRFELGKQGISQTWLTR